MRKIITILLLCCPAFGQSTSAGSSSVSGVSQSVATTPVVLTWGTPAVTSSTIKLSWVNSSIAVPQMECTLTSGGSAKNALDYGIFSGINVQQIVEGLLPSTSYTCIANNSTGASSNTFVISTSAAASTSALTNVSLGTISTYNSINGSNQQTGGGDTYLNCTSNDGLVYFITEDTKFFTQSGLPTGLPALGSNISISKFTSTSPLAAITVNPLLNYGFENTGNGVDNLSQKGSGMYCMAGNLYVFLSRIQESCCGHPASSSSFPATVGQFISSYDKGVSWTNYLAPTVSVQAGNITNPTNSTPFGSSPLNGSSATFVMTCGDDGTLGYFSSATTCNQQDNDDAFIYGISNEGCVQGGGAGNTGSCGNSYYLWRMPRYAMLPGMTFSKLQWYTGGDGSLDANWTATQASAYAMLTNTGELSWANVQFIRSAGRYLLSTHYYPSGVSQTTGNVCSSVLEFYDGAHPWGNGAASGNANWALITSIPYTTAGYYNPIILNNSAWSGLTPTMLLTGAFAGTCTGASYQMYYTTATLTQGTPQAAAPVFSVGSGAVAAGTAVTISSSTPGSTVYYSWAVNGGTPVTPTHTTGANSDEYPTPFSGTFQYLPSYVSTFNIYGQISFTAIAHAPGYTDSAPVTYNYTLTSATGTPISACGTLSSAGTYYLTGNLSSAGTCIYLGANAINLNLNGHGITYGTGDTPLTTGTTASVTSGSPIVSATGIGSSCVVGERVYVSQTGAGAYLNTVSTVATGGCSTNAITLNANVNFTQSGAAAWSTYNSQPTYGIDCDQAITSGKCIGSVIYNGSVAQPSANISPNSNAISMGNVSGFADSSGSTISNIVGTIYGPESMCGVFNYYTGSQPSPVTGNTFAFDTCNDNSTLIYNRDQIPGFPYEMQTGNDINVSTTSYMHDLSIPIGSPQGCVATQNTTIIENINCTAGTTQYVVGYAAFSSANGSTIVGVQGQGNMRGIEIEASNNTALYNIINTVDATLVQDPNHNPPGCEIDGNYGFRIKDYSGTFNAITGLSIHDNWIESSTGGCPGQVIRCTLCGSADGGTIGTNNLFVLNMAANVGPSSIYSTDQANMSGFTYSSNIYSITGTFASNGYWAYISGSGVNNWTIPGGVSPRIFNGTTTPATPSSLPTTATFTGTGSATCGHAGGGVSNTITYNGTTVPCP